MTERSESDRQALAPRLECSGTEPHAGLLRLQRLVGNRAVASRVKASGDESLPAFSVR